MMAHVLSVRREQDVACVRVRGFSGREFAVEFRGVQAVRAKKPEGMMIYALSEIRAQPPLRKFVFANWDDDDESFLEIEAESFSVADIQTKT
jgi:hypothetical protein